MEFWYNIFKIIGFDNGSAEQAAILISRYWK